MIKAISNLTNQNTMHTTDIQAPTPAGRPTIFSRTRSLLRRVAAIAVLLLAVSIPAMAYDYVITYTTGNTTYYLGMNGNNLQAKTTFDPTCVWTCYNGETEATLGSTSYSLRNKNNSSYYLTTTCTRSGSWWSGYSYSWSAITVQTSANNIWRSSNATSGNVYAYNSDYQQSASIYVNNLTMNGGNTSDSKNVRVTVTSAIDDISNPTISGSDIITSTGNSNYTASGAKYKLGYVNYFFSNTDHYFDKDGNSFSGSPSNATIGTYTWSLTDNAYASLDANNPGRVVVSALPASDLTLTLTVSATATGGKPAAPAGTVLSATKEIIIQGTKPSAPIISISGTTVTLSTNASGSTTIRYTIDGSDPTTSSTAYSSPIDLSSSTTSPVTIKAITVRSGNTSDIAEGSVTLTLPAPVITINGEAKTATISCSIPGTTIRYTVNSSDPTASFGTIYDGSTITGLSYMAEIKAIAIKDGWNDSPVSSDVVTIPSGVNPSSGEVTLFDYEPHSWSYYSDADLPDQLHSLNPADIKITYNGNGTGNMTAATGAEAVDAPTSFSLDAEGVQVGPNDAANKFIYYKTLERENPNGTGNLPYTTIPNPFQVRPTGESATVNIIPSSRDIVIVTSRNGNSTSGWDRNSGKSTLTVTCDGNTLATINSRTTTTVTVPVGKTVTFSFNPGSASDNEKGRCRVTVYYDQNNGTTAISEYNPSTNANTTKTLTVATPSGQQVTVSAYRGFYAWKVKNLSNGLTIKDAENTNTTYAVNSIIPAERKILFVTSNEYNNEVVFEALWAQAYVQTGTNDLTNYVSASVTSAYERNFHVVNASTDASNFQKSYPCTVIGHNPNSTTLNNTRTITNGFSAASDTKFEDVVWNGNNGTITCNNHDVIIGRGVETTGNYCANMVQGMPDITANVTANLTYTMRIESGKFHYFSFINGYTDDSGTTHQASNYNTYSYSGSANSIKVVLGCDYDRALGENGNSNLTLTGPAIMGYRSMMSSTDNRTRKTLDLTVKSGSFTTGIGNNMGTGDVQEGFYLSVAGSHTNVGERFVTIEGGVFANIAGGIDGLNNTTSSSAENWSNLGRRSLTIRMKGGKVKGAFYGGAAVSPGSGDRCMIFTGGTVEGWIGAGCNGVVSSNTTSGGQTHGVSYVYFGGRTHCGGYEGQINGGTSGDVFGAGKGSGAEDDQSSGQLTYGTNIAIADNCVVDHNVYGGGNYGFALVETNMYIFGGNVKGAVFGGANQNNGPDVNITMKGGLIEGGVYGGSNSSGKVASATMQIDGGQVGTSSVTANIHGGGYGSSTKLTGNVNLTLGTQGQTTPGVTVYGDVYGGSGYGSVNGGTGNNDAASDTYHTNVTLNAGTINGSLYGGALGSNSIAANVYGPVTVTVNGGSVKKTDANGANGSGAVYGCNNINGAPQRAVSVIINGTDPAPSTDEYALFAVYGGGNQASYSYGTPTVTVNNCDNSIEYVYGGGNAAHITNGNTDVKIYGGNKIGNVFGGGNGTVTAANVSGNTNVNIYGGTIGRVFGGSNSAGTIGGTLNVNIEKNSSCAIQVGSVYSGGNKAASNLGTITVGCMDTADMIDSLFCGANQANVTGSVNFTMKGGRIGNLFGGNNQSGNVSGSITVTVDWSQGSCSNNYLGNVFGGGNLATFGTTQSPKAPTVQIYHGTVSGNVYGGGKGLDSDHTKGQVTGNPIVTIGDSNGSHTATIEGDVYGGGDAGNVVGTPQVTVIDKASTTIGNVYGGGNAADVSGTDVKIQGGHITGDVFGGGHGDKASLNGINGETGHSDKVANVSGSSSVSVTGGIINRVFAGSNLNGSIGTDPNSTMTLTINKTSTNTPMKIGEVYGGANMANGKAASISIGCTGTLVSPLTGNDRYGYEQEGIGTVYGGANQANIGAEDDQSDIEVNINSGIVANVFGGNNTSGTIYGTITVNIEKTSDSNTCGWYVGNVFGGGNLATYTGSPAVNIKNGTVSGNVYGGGKGDPTVTGNQAGVPGSVTGNPIVTIGDTQTQAYEATIAGDVYGGGDAAKVNGNTHIVFGKANNSAAKLFGGGNAAGVTGTATVDMSAGAVAAGVYGGCNASGSVDGAIAVNITGGTVGSTTERANIHGGGYGQSTVTGASVTVTIGPSGNGTGPIIYGDVYGGSALGSINSNAQNPTVNSSSATQVTMNKGTVYGDIYGGGLGDLASLGNGHSDVQAKVWSPVTVTVNGGTISTYAAQDTTLGGNVFGCNNLNGTPKGSVAVNINGTSATQIVNGDTIYALSAVYGGGNLAHYDPTNPTESYPTVTITGCNTSIENVYGGGNAAAVPRTNIVINGGDIDCVFAGGNGESGTPANVGYKNADVTPTSGSYGAGTASALIKGGTINKIFGGSNSKGTIRESGSLQIAKPTSGEDLCDMIIGEVYGGGNLAAGAASRISIGCTGTGNNEGITTVYGGANAANVSGNISLTIEEGKIANVYGGNNSSGTISGTITVNINQKNNPCAWEIGNVYGGGKDAAYTNSGANYPEVNIIKGIVSGNVFGGGYGQTARVTANPRVNLIGGTVSGNIFGGGEAAPVTGNPLVTANYGSVTNLYGGGLGASATVTGNPAVNVNFTSGTLTINDVFGGGDAAAVTGNTSVTLTAGSVHKLFGGGNAASVSGTTTVTLTTGSVSGGVYGGCNASGSVGAVTIALNGGQVGATGTGNSADVYGGGYGSATTTTGNIGVTLNGTTVYGDIYGGSALGGVNASTSNTTTVTLSTATLHGSVFGGGKGDNASDGQGHSDVAAVSNGNTIVNINVANTNLTGIYGGANARGNVKGAIAVNINANVGASGSGNGLDIFGGGYGAATNTEGNVTVTIGNLDGTITPVIYGDIYGGSALGNVNNDANDITKVDFLNGTLHGNLYGGGLGDAQNAAKVNGQVVVNISNTTQTAANCHIDLRDASIYGGNNTNGSPQDNITVNVYKTAYNYSDYASGDNYTAADGAHPYYAIDQVFGGGNQADYAPEDGLASSTKKTTVHIYGCDNTVRRVFGGGNAAAAVGLVTIIDGGRFDYVFGGGNGETSAANIVAGGTNLQVHGGNIRTLFGGSNTSGTITGQMRVNVDGTGACASDMYIAEFFCGNNLAPIGTQQSPTNINATIGCDTRFGDVYGGCNLADIWGNVTLTIVGGTMNNVYGGSKGRAADPANNITAQAADIHGNVTLNIHGGLINQNAYGGSNINGNIMGSITVDMDWSQASSSCNAPANLHVGNVYGASNLAAYTPTTPGNYPAVSIKHGTVSGSVFGGGKGAPATVTSNPVVTIGDSNADHCAIVTENVYGGGDAAAVSGNATVVYNDNNSSSTVAKLFGGGNAANVSGTTSVTLTNGKVTGGVYGGCNTTGSVDAVTVALNGGQVGASGAGNEASVYGGGYGHSTSTTGNIGVTLGNATVYGDIYGGSALGSVNASTSNTTTITIGGNALHGTIYGGGMGSGTGDATRAVSNGNVQINYNTANAGLTGLYGGANVNGQVAGNIELNVNANVGASGNGNSINIFGGGYGAATATGGNVNVTVGNATGSIVPVVYGDIYGGSALGNVNDAAADITTVNFLNGTLHGNLYGGGLGDAQNAAKVNGQVVVNISNTTQTAANCHIDLRDASIYGGNNTNGSPQDNITVNVYKTAYNYSDYASGDNYTAADGAHPYYAIDQVFGGGNQADYAPEDGLASSTKKTTVHIYGCDNTVRRVFGGGNAAAAVGLVTIIDGGRFDYVFGGGNGETSAANIVAGGTNLQVHGGNIRTLFGGSNTSGTITGQMRVNVDGTGACASDMYIAEFFCGNNLAPIGTQQSPTNINATIGCDTRFGDVYGGCNLADIWGNVTLTIVGGTMNNVYGGSKGRAADPANNITAQAADIHGNVTLNIHGGLINQNAYGGSNINGNIMGSITVDMDWSQASSSCNAPANLHVGNVYGASNLAAYTPTTPGNYPAVSIKHGTVSGSVFGGGKGASAVVTSNPVVTVGDLTSGHEAYLATIVGDVYGGGDAAAVTGYTTVLIQKSNTVAGNAYGGGNAAAISGSATLTMTAGTVGNLYGGGNAAGVGSTATVNMNGGTVTTGIYGGCNSTGTIAGAVAVNINGGTVGTNATSTANVHGGGYGSSTATGDNVTVTIGNGTSTPVVWGDVYGGSALGNVNDATAEITKVWLKSGTINGCLYGGGLGDATHPALVNGKVQVVVDGGEVKTTTNNQRTTGAVFGCNNVNGTPKSTVEVTINSTVATTMNGENKVYALQGVYGGGNLAHFDPTTPGNYPTVTINGCGTSIKDVFGGGNAAAVPYTYVTINGGDINRVSAGGNGESGTPANVGYKNTATTPTTDSYGTGTATVLITDGTIHQVFAGSNANGTIRSGGSINVERGATTCGLHIGEIYGGGNLAHGNAGTINIGCTGAQGEGIGDVYGGANQANVGNNILLNITGGSIDRVFGGNNTSGTISGTITVNVEWDNSSCYKYLGSVFGGGNLASYTGSPVVNINNGTVTNNVYGGGKGSSAVVTGNPVVTVGDLTNGHSSYVAVVTGDVYGGGDAAAVTGNTSVTIQKANTNVGSAYGGGNAAAISGTTLLTMTDGTAGNLYGGGNAAGVGSTATVNMNGGTVTTGIYGGCNSTGDITGAVTVNINGGTIGSSSSAANIHGGGFGQNTTTSNNVEVTIGSAVGAQTYPTIYGDVYGGSALGKVNGTSVNTNLHTYVTMNAGTINGSLYGGALGDNSVPANVYAPVTVTVNSGTITGEVYGCNNVNGAPQSTVTVDINGTDMPQSGYALGKVFGGGNHAPYAGTPVVTVHNCDNSIEYVYGGGNAASVAGTNVTIYGGNEIGNVFGGCYGADVTTSGTLVKIYGGKIGKVFGGSNSSGTITGAISVTVDKTTETGHNSCNIDIAEVYGGGNMAASSAGTLNIGCADHIGSVYGGSNDANITGNILLNITSGHIDNVFGGNNTGHSITGTITVNIDDAQNSCGMEIGNVYGGGNMAAYTYAGNYPVVNIKKGTITGDVFGGGYGGSATVTANPQVVLTGGTITGRVFGGGALAPVSGNPTVTASGANVTAGRLYGGGLGSSATVTGNTTVTVSGGTYGYVFGGGEAANQTGDVVVNIQGGTINNDVYGGGALAHTNTANLNTTTDVITPATKTTTVNVTSGTMKNVYGGGLGNATTEALVYGNVAVNLNYGVAADSKGAVVTDYLFGCNNINGSPKGSVTVHVYATQNSATSSILVKNQDSFDMKGVYGGGNMAAYKPYTAATATNVIIEGCGLTSIDYVYGGGNAAPVPATVVDIYGSYQIGSVFGGGNGKDQITVNGVLTDNPGADVGIYKVDYDTWNSPDNRDLKYTDNSPNHDKGDDYYILYGSTAGQSIIGTTHVTFYGGNITHLFGGSNTKGDIVKEAKVILGDEDLKTCEFNVGDVYGGSNEAYMSGTSNIDMNCTDGMGQIYGGSRMADVHNDIVLTITGGHYQKVFGGNNLSGRIYGSITVNIEQTGCLPIEIDELYGGGNEAAYSVYGYNGNTPIEGNENDRLWADPQINIKSFKSIGTVFGGGYGATADVIGNPTININTVEGWTNGDYQGKNTDPEHPDPHAEFVGVKKNLGGIGEIGTVFGGGNQAIVKGDTYINIGTQDQVTIHNVSKAVYNTIKTGRDDITNPGFTDQDDEDATKDLTITVNGVNITGNVYGGGNQADVTGATHVVVGKEQQEQQQQQGGGGSGAPRRTEQEPAQNNQSEQPQQPQTNAATESQQTRSLNATRQ